MSKSEVKLSDCLQPAMDDWWAIYTRHQHEKTVAGMLTAKGCEVFLPQFDVIRRWKDRKMKLSLPLFPCYLFMRSDTGRRLQVITTPGVHMIVRRGEHFATVTSEEVEALQRAVQGPFRVEPHPFMRCGERVRVTRGALEGIEGILVRKKNLCRLVLSVDLLARAAAVEVDAADVTPVRAENTKMYSPSERALCMPTGLGAGSIMPGLPSRRFSQPETSVFGYTPCQERGQDALQDR